MVRASQNGPVNILLLLLVLLGAAAMGSKNPLDRCVDAIGWLLRWRRTRKHAAAHPSSATNTTPTTMSAMMTAEVKLDDWLQSEPVWLESQSHAGVSPDVTHTPCPLQSLSGAPAHEGMLQSSARKPWLHTQVGLPRLLSHTPRPLHTKGDPAHVYDVH